MLFNDFVINSKEANIPKIPFSLATEFIFSSKSFDGRGNYSMGLKEQIVFPEIDFDKIDRIRGLDITITTTARSDDEGRALMRAFGFPFK